MLSVKHSKLLLLIVCTVILLPKHFFCSQDTAQKVQLTYAHVLVKNLEKQDVEYIFGLIGTNILSIFDALIDSHIKFVTARHEQAATHMADGYAHIAKKPGVVLVTGGPGEANTISGIATAYKGSVPMIILCGEISVPFIGKGFHQDIDIIDITKSIVKQSFVVRDAKDLSRIIQEAFHVATSGRPGPVLISLPINIMLTPFTGSLDEATLISSNDTETTLPENDILTMANLIHDSKKPVILVGRGAIISGAEKEVIELAEKLNAPVISTFAAKGVFPESHQLSLGPTDLTAWANLALANSDLIVAIGSRWDSILSIEKACPNAKKLDINIDPQATDYAVRPDMRIIGDAKNVVRSLIKLVEPLETTQWLKQIHEYQTQFPLKYSNDDKLHPQFIIEQLHKLTEGKAILVLDSGQNVFWTLQYYKCDYSNRLLYPGRLYLMGYSLPAAIGAHYAKPKDLVISIVGDGGFQMTSYELATIAAHKLPIKIIILDNSYFGFIRQEQELRYKNRLIGVDLLGNPNFGKLAKAYGIKCFEISKASEVKTVLTKALKYNGPCIVHCSIVRDENVFPIIEFDTTVDKMILESPTSKIKHHSNITLI